MTTQNPIVMLAVTFQHFYVHAYVCYVHTLVAVDSNYTTTTATVESDTKSNSELIMIMSVTLGIFLLITTIVIMTCTLVVCIVRHKKTDCKDNT